MFRFEAKESIDYVYVVHNQLNRIAQARSLIHDMGVTEEARRTLDFCLESKIASRSNDSLIDIYEECVHALNTLLLRPLPVEEELDRVNRECERILADETLPIHRRLGRARGLKKLELDELLKKIIEGVRQDSRKLRLLNYYSSVETLYAILLPSLRGKAGEKLREARKLLEDGELEKAVDMIDAALEEMLKLLESAGLLIRMQRVAVGGAGIASRRAD